MTDSNTTHAETAPTLWSLAGREPTDVAMSDIRRTLTWADLERETIQFGRGLEAKGLVPGGGSPEAFRSFIDSEGGKWGAIIAKVGIRLDQ